MVNHAKSLVCIACMLHKWYKWTILALTKLARKLVCLFAVRVACWACWACFLQLKCLGAVFHRSQLCNCLLLCNNGLLLGTAALRLLWGLCGGLGHNWVCTSCGASVGPLDVVVFD